MGQDYTTTTSIYHPLDHHNNEIKEINLLLYNYLCSQHAQYLEKNQCFYETLFAKDNHKVLVL